MAHKRICYICRKTYSYCPQCEEDAMKPTWMFAFCSEKCKKINDILAGHTSGRISTQEAKRALEEIKFSIEDISEKQKSDIQHAKEILNFVEKSVPVKKKPVTTEK